MTKPTSTSTTQPTNTQVHRRIRVSACTAGIMALLSVFTWESPVTASPGSRTVTVFARGCSGGTVKQVIFSTPQGEWGYGQIPYSDSQFFVALYGVPPGGTTLNLRIQCSKGWYYPSVRVTWPSGNSNTVDLRYV
jgi:hypothetical protein